MSAFTFSAPIVTPEQEQAEREALPEEERQRIHEEVYGSELEIKETDAMAEKAVLLLHEALNEIPDASKQAYLEASKRAPLLVEKESAPIRFLRCEKYNAWAAAHRLVAYWEARKKMFGPDRAFLPMTQTGAMAEDMEYSEKALITMLPDDDHGRPVLCWDRIRSTAAVAPRASVMRCCFYVLQVLSEEERAQKRGCVTVANYRGYDIYKHFDRSLSKNLGLLTKCFPVKIKAVHMCTGSGKMFLDVVTPVIKHMMGKENRLHMNIHAGSDTEVLVRLKPFGLGEVHIKSFFGKFLQLVQSHGEWLNQRKAVEHERESHLS